MTFKLCVMFLLKTFGSFLFNAVLCSPGFSNVENKLLKFILIQDARENKQWVSVFSFESGAKKN